MPEQSADYQSGYRYLQNAHERLKIDDMTTEMLMDWAGALLCANADNARGMADYLIRQYHARTAPAAEAAFIRDCERHAFIADLLEWQGKASTRTIEITQRPAGISAWLYDSSICTGAILKPGDSIPDLRTIKQSEICKALQMLEENNG